MPITLLALVITFIIQPNVVHLSRLLDGKQFTNFRKMVTKLSVLALSIGFAVLLITYLIGVQLLQFVFGVDFEPYKTALMIIMIGAIANAIVSVYINILIIMRQFKAQFYILLMTNIALVIASISVVKIYEMTGGSVLYMITNFIQMSLLIYVYVVLLRKWIHNTISD
jgi:O-antigen/teichoic acid export membrane protein